jgi:tRNA(fMet)-specific endonuclease VapC
LQTHINTFEGIPVIGFNAKAGHVYDGLQQERIRIGRMDLKIAAIALASNATLLSRNITDFSKVPGLRVEDWSL